MENVLGLLRVWPAVRRHLSKCGDYYIATLRVDPRHFGADTSRGRAYIAMVHKSTSGGMTQEQMSTKMCSLLQRLKKPVLTKWEHLLFRASHAGDHLQVSGLQT